MEFGNEVDRMGDSFRCVEFVIVSNSPENVLQNSNIAKRSRYSYIT